MVMSSFTPSKKVLRARYLSLGGGVRGSKYLCYGKERVMFVGFGGIAVFVKKKYLASRMCMS